MKRKIICILVSMLMCVTVFSVTAKTNEKTEEPISMGLAPILNQGTNIQTPTVTFYDPAKAFWAYPTPTGPCEFNLASPGTITLLTQWAPGANGFCTGAAWTKQGKWYMTDYSTASSSFYELDPTTGANTLIGSTTKSIHAMAYDPSTDTIYAAGGAGNANSLYTINPTTGAATLVGAFGGGLAYMLMLACDGNGNMYGIDISTDNLYSIDKSTGTATSIGSTGQSFNYAQDMAYDIDNSILYVAGYTTTGTLFTCNTQTGACTAVGPFQSGAEIDAFAIPYVANEPPLTPGAPSGPTSGITDVEYTFTATTTDPEGDPIEYWFEWGDGDNSGWVSPGSASHAWTDAGSYDVTVKARDAVNGGESAFSPAHVITILSGPLIEIKKITGGLFRIKANINNSGALEATNVEWTITLEGGAFTGKSSSGTIDSIPAGGSAPIHSKLIMGFGATKVTITASVTESSDTELRNGQIYLFYIIVHAGGG